MAIKITIDTKELNAKLAELASKSVQAAMKAASDVCEEILRIAENEVPFDKGLLKGSGHKEPETGGYIVGYNKVYAARLHEHPEYNFRNGRKGKYLEDPIKQNLDTFTEVISKAITGELL